MRVLLDTHVVLWALADSPRLTPAARRLLGDSDNECFVSSASAWEISIKVAIGKHRLAFPLDLLGEVIAESGLHTLDVTMPHALAVAAIDTPHADPFDRLLLAQCEIETLRLLTADRVLSQLPVAIPA